MKENIVLRWAAGVCLWTAFGMALASSDSRVEPNSFLSKRADTISQLVNEVGSDRTVADRYERHFGKTKSEISAYFGTLHLARLNEDGTFMIYSVDDKGVIKAHPQRLKTGTKVFADASGMPILKASCGNAMVSGSNAQSTSLIAPSITGAAESLKAVPVTTPDALEEYTKTTAITPGSPIALAPEMPQLSTGGSNQGIASLPAALAALGGAGALLISSHGSSPVPEPASMVVMIGAVAAYKCRRKKK